MPPAFGDAVDIDGEETANHQPHNGDADTPINSTNTHPGTNAGTRAPGARAAGGQLTIERVARRRVKGGGVFFLSNSSIGQG